VQYGNVPYGHPQYMQQPQVITNTIVVSHGGYHEGRSLRICMAIFVIVVYSILAYFEIISVHNPGQWTGGRFNTAAIPITLLIFTFSNIGLAFVAIFVEYRCLACNRCGQEFSRYLVWILMSVGQFIIFLLPVVLLTAVIIGCASVGSFVEQNSDGSEADSTAAKLLGEGCGIVITAFAIPCFCCMICTCMMIRATHLARPKHHADSVAMPPMNVHVATHHGLVGHHPVVVLEEDHH